MLDWLRSKPQKYVLYKYGWGYEIARVRPTQAVGFIGVVKVCGDIYGLKADGTGTCGNPWFPHSGWTEAELFSLVKRDIQRTVCATK